MRRFPSAVADGLARRRKRSRTKRARSTPRCRGVVWSCSRTVFSILLVCWGIRYFEVVSSSLSPFPRTPFSLCYLLPALTRSGNSKFMVDSPSKIERRAWRCVNMRPARDFAGVSEAERIPLPHSFSGRPSCVFLQAERIPLPHSGCVKSGEAESFPLQEMILHPTKQRISS